MQSEHKSNFEDLNESIIVRDDVILSRSAPNLESKSGKSSTASTVSLNNYYFSPKEETSKTYPSVTTLNPKTPSKDKKEPHFFPAINRTKNVPKISSFISPARALLDYFENLSVYERDEISLYDEIYFVGPNCKKLETKFDDEEGYYKAVIGDHLSYRYEVKELLGCGTFGHVFRCYDYKRNIEVAVKIIRNKIIYRKAGDLENKILHELAKADPNDCNCIIKKLRSFEFRSHLCLVFELLSLNLYQFLHVNNFRGISVGLIRRIAVQMFMALKTAHSVGIIHCDLKPDNVLLKHENKSSIKVIDFGSACQEGNKVFEYIQSRYYRAPEIVIETPYDKSIDIWSLGCILFELLTGYPLFPAESEQDLFRMYVEVLGTPPAEFMNKGRRKHHYIERNGKIKKNIKPNLRPLSLLLENFDPKIIQLLEKCLMWVPEHRIQAEEGLLDPWVSGQSNKSKF
jgi:dual specificity tyrosine-phosphorylation-regulated kinase 2/3/4